MKNIGSLQRRIGDNGILLMLIGSLFFSMMHVCTRFATHRIPFMEALFFRASVNFALLLPWVLLNRVPCVGARPLLLLVRSIFGFGSVALFFYTLTKIGLAEATVLNNTSVIFVAVLSAFVLKEKLSLKLCSYTLVSFLGCIAILKPWMNVFNFAGAAGLMGGFLLAIVYLIIKTLHKSESSQTIVLNFMFYSALFALLLSWNSFLMPQGVEWVALLVIGVFGTLGQLAMTHAYRYSPASIVAPYSFSVVLFNAVWGLAFWKEMPDYWSVFGSVMIVGAGIGILKLKKS